MKGPGLQLVVDAEASSGAHASAAQPEAVPKVLAITPRGRLKDSFIAHNCLDHFECTKAHDSNQVYPECNRNH